MLGATISNDRMSIKEVKTDWLMADVIMNTDGSSGKLVIGRRSNMAAGINTLIIMNSFFRRINIITIINKLSDCVLLCVIH